MKIFSICLTHNESDILARTVRAALSWSDRIFIVDHQSSDETADVVKRLSQENERVEFVARCTGTFTNGFRAIPYQRYAHLATPGEDWWCRLDSDEIYIDDPRQFLAHVPRLFRSVYSASFQYYFTEKDAEQYEHEANRYLGGNAADNLHYYLCNHSELRFMRHTGAPWPQSQGWPSAPYIFPVYPRRIQVRHLQYRYPEQIQQRLDVRVNIADRQRFKHERAADWRYRMGGEAAAWDNTSDCPMTDDDCARVSWRSRMFNSTELKDDRADGLVADQAKLPSLPSKRQQALALARRPIADAAAWYKRRSRQQ